VQEVVPAGAHVQRAADLAHLIAQQARWACRPPWPARAGVGRGPDAARDCIASLLPGIMRSQDAAKGCAASLNGARHVSPATDRFRRAACCAPCGHIR